MSAEERLQRALGARVVPAKDMHFKLLVLQRAEAERFRAETARRVLRGGALASVAALVVVTASGWAAQNADLASDLILISGGLLAFLSLSRLVRRGPAASRRLS